MRTLSVVVPATNAPPTLGACLAALEAARGEGDEVVVVERATGPGPAAARNEGARRAAGEVVVFVDADVLVHADALARIRRRFSADRSLAALFGAYDDEPAAPGVVSQFRNLLHHHVHASSPGPAATFWAGLGAVRRDALRAVGGFDERRYARPSVEDIDLGLRLTRAGYRIELDPRVRGTHLKHWTLVQMLRTDFADRGVPWVELLLRERAGATALNLGWRHRASALAAVAVAASVLARRPRALAATAAALVVLNSSFYRLLAERRGPAEAAAGVVLHVLHHLTGAAAVPVGAVRYAFSARPS